MKPLSIHDNGHIANPENKKIPTLEMNEKIPAKEQTGSYNSSGISGSV